MKSFIAGALALLVAVACATVALAQEQQPENIALDNSDAVARKLFSMLVERQVGAPVPPDRFWAYELDLNLDGFSEIYGFVDQPNCDGTKCGLFLFVLEGGDYREALGDIPGARLTDPTKVFLGTYKRNGFLELQLGDTTAGWNGQTYVDAATFTGTALDGAAFLQACRKSRTNEVQQDGEADAVANECQCRFDRLQAIGFSQAHLDAYATYLDTYDGPENDSGWDTALVDAGDVDTGCDVAAGKTQWQPSGISHGEQQQTERLDFDGFIDACKGEDWILTHRKTGSPDRGLGLCGCLARELPTYGVDQDQMDLLTRYYAGDVSDTDVDQQYADLLNSHDAASEACLQSFPPK
jgi:hypothetical protein